MYDTALRKSPEGKDSETFVVEDKSLLVHNANSLSSHNNNGVATSGNVASATLPAHQKIGNDISTEIFSASNDNGKINVQVTVLVGEFCFRFSFYFSSVYFQEREATITCNQEFGLFFI